MALDTKLSISQISKQLSWAREPEEIFGYEADEQTVKQNFRALAKRLHPDTVSADEKDMAVAAMQRLNDLYKDANNIMTVGSYANLRFPNEVEIGADTYNIFHQYSSNEIAADYTLVGRDVMRVPHTADTNDLMQAEVDALGRIELNLLNGKNAGMNVFFPNLYKSVMARTADGAKRVNIVNYNNTADMPEYLLSVQQLGEYYKQQLDARQVAWIWRKILIALDVTHRAGVVHGAVLPDNILVNTADHLICLTNWQFSTLDLKPLVATSAAGLSFYPSEVNFEGKTTYGLDIYTAAKSVMWASAKNMGIPPIMVRYFNWVAGQSTMGRPQDARIALGEFDLMIAGLWGERKFVPMPNLTWPVYPVEELA